MRTITGRQTLIFDADDTLWENNVYFERAIDDFIAWLDHSTMTPDEVRATLDAVQRGNIAEHGYGSSMFGRSLTQVWRQLRDAHLDDSDLATVLGFAERIMRQEIELLPEVASTLDWLAERHDLVLLTKGHPEEQQLKIDRSGIGDRFSRTIIVREKDAAVYRETARELGVENDRTWMIGNSPRSDINPALAAGLGAVLVPHPMTWRMEHDEVATPDDPDRLLVLETIAELTAYFPGEPL